MPKGKEPWEMTRFEYLKKEPLPPMERLPEKGQYPAVQTKDGSIYVDKNPQNSTHVLFIEKMGIPPEQIKSGGWIKDGVYEGSIRSHTGRYAEQMTAAKKVEHRLLVAKAVGEGRPVPESVLMNYPELKPKPGQSLRGTGAEVQSVSDVYPKPDIHDGSEIPIRPNVEIQTELTPPPTSTAGAFDVERTTRHSWREALSPESQQYVRGVEKNQGKQAIHFNKKTGLSVDFSTSCPKRHSGFGACPYCYVDNDRVAKDLKIGIMMGKPVTDNPYTDEIMKMPADLIWELNKDGGLRMFSFGDFRPGIDDKSVIGLLNDAQARDLHIRAITKQKEFIERFGDHPNLRINISTDPYLPREMSNAPTVQEALQWAGNRGNIKIRAVALNEKQAEKLATDSNIDVVTMYHGFTNFDGKTGVRHDKLWKIVSTQNPDLVKKVGAKRLKAELDTWENMGANSKKFRRVDQKYKGRLCCGGGKCSRDSTKCGFGLGSLGALIMGVHLPMLTEGDDED